MGEWHECEVCEHVGEDVSFQKHPYKSGFFCDDSEACFQRFRDTRDSEPEQEKVEQG